MTFDASAAIPARILPVSAFRLRGPWFCGQHGGYE
jgi:hypothetical protein